MDTLASRRAEMLGRVRQFGEAHAALFPAGSLGARTFAELGDILDRLRASTDAEVAGWNAARAGTDSKTTARVALRDALKIIARTARGIAVDTQSPSGAFRVPDGKNERELLLAAHAISVNAAPLAASFVAHGLADSFLADLEAAIEGFEHASSARGNARKRHVSARAGISAAIGDAFAILPRLDAIVENRVAGDTALLVTWRAGRRVGRRRGRPPASAAKEASAA